MPAPIGNTNAQTHGARKRSVALDGSGLPKGCGKDELRTRLLRRMVEAEFSRIHNGKPPLYLLDLRAHLVEAILHRQHVAEVDRALQPDSIRRLAMSRFWPNGCRP